MPDPGDRNSPESDYRWWPLLVIAMAAIIGFTLVMLLVHQS